MTAAPIALVRPWWSRWWRLEVVVDEEEGLAVRNIVRRHRVPWREVVALELTVRSGPTAGRVALALLHRRHGAPIDVGAVGCVGHRRRVAWVEAVAPVLLAHGVAIVSGAGASVPWRGLRRPEVVGAETLWRVDHETPMADLRRAIAEIDGDLDPPPSNPG